MTSPPSYDNNSSSIAGSIGLFGTNGGGFGGFGGIGNSDRKEPKVLSFISFIKINHDVQGNLPFFYRIASGVHIVIL